MSESKDKPAFPYINGIQDFSGNSIPTSEEGMSLKQYAAIHLKVPMSGTPWLDEMIEASRRDEFAKASLIGRYSDKLDIGCRINTGFCFEDADVMLAVSNKRKEGE